MENIALSEETKTLADLNNQADSTGRWYQALIGENLGRRTLKFSLSLKDFFEGSAVGNRATIENTQLYSGEFHAQRSLDTGHATGLGRYTLMGLVRVVIKDYGPNGNDLLIRDIGEAIQRKTGAYEVAIGQRQTMWVVDGQHRRAGFDKVLSFLKTVTQTYKYPNKGGLFKPSNYTNTLIDQRTHEFWSKILEVALTRATISVECHLGLKEDEEQQLFYDLNSKGKKVTQSLAFQYDHTDPINKFVGEELIEGKILKFKPSDKDVSDWQTDDGSISRKDIQTVTCLLGLGKSNSKTATPAIVEQRRAYLVKFWEIINKAESFGIEMAKSKTLLAQPVMLKALAKLSFDLAYGHQNIRNEEGYKKLCNSINNRTLEFSHSDEIWQSLFMDAATREKKFPGISNYIYVPQDTNLDAGTYDPDNGWVRFGSRHNDIFPRLGDIIRFKLDLKPRPSVEKLKLTALN